MNTQNLKKCVAQAALEKVEDGIILGVGSGSTMQYFIEALQASEKQFRAVVAASKASEKMLIASGYPIADLNSLPRVDLYVDSCDEITPERYMIKGGGAALTREKILASSAQKFLCIADASKQVSVLGAFPLPVEVIPMAREMIIRQLSTLGGEIRWRENVITDNGNDIVDIHGLSITDPEEMEIRLSAIAGIVTVGIFAKNRADIALISEADGRIVTI